MRKSADRLKRIISSVLVVSFLAGPLMQLTVVAEDIPDTKPYSLGYSDSLGNLTPKSNVIPNQDLSRFTDTDNWGDISRTVGQYYGQWKDENYSGAYSSKLPNTALLGNGDVGITSAGGRAEKTFLISKSDFWSAGNMAGTYGSQDDATKPVAIGGVTIRKQTPVTDRLNLAPTHTEVSSSSHHDDFEAKLAVNGNMQVSQDGYGWVTSVGKTHWLELSFDEPIVVASWVVKGDGAVRSGHSQNNPRTFKLQTSDTGGESAAWTDAGVVANNTEDVFTGLLDEPVTSAHFRLYITEPLQQGNNDPSPRARIGQFELYSEPPTIITPESKNLALRKPIKACEYHPTDNSEPDGMVDGIPNTKWCSTTDHSSPHWAIIDLGERKQISSYAMHNANTIGESIQRNTKDFQLQYLTDEAGVDWDTIDQETGWVDMDSVTGNNESILSRNLATPVTARYVRLWVTKASAESTKEHVLRIHELELYSEAQGKEFYEKQDILNAQILTEMQIDGAELEMQTVMCATENMMVTQVTSNADQPVDLEMLTWAKADNTKFPVTEQATDDTLLVTRATNNNAKDNLDSWTSKAAIATKIVGAAGVTRVNDGSGSATVAFTLTPGQTVYLLTAIGGGGQTYNSNDVLNSTDPIDVASSLLAQTVNTADIDSLLSDHADWWKDYWSASYIDLEGYDEVEKYYYGAQYLLGCTAREGNLAPGLYGIWQTNDNPSWSSDYHLNYNFIATFYGANSSNRSSLTLPAGEAMLSFVPEGLRRTSNLEQLKRINSAYVTSRTDLHDGIADAVLYPVGIGPWGTVTDDTYHNEALNASYSSYPLIQYYLYTMDEEYLDEKVYDYLKKCAAFYEAWLENDGGAYILYAGYNEGSWAKNPAVELAALKNVLSTLINASETLGRDADKRTQWQEIYDNLAPQPTSTWKDKKVYSLAEQEWRGGAWTDMENPVPGDGNIIPLDIIIPGGQLGYYSPDEELQVARNTIDVFGNNAWRQINNFPRIFTDAIRSRYPATTILDMMTSTINSQMAANLRINDGVHGVEKIGATEAINSMLITSHKDILKVFPNWPADKDATFSQLRAVGAFVVSSKYDGSSKEIEYIKIISEAGGPLTMALPWAEGTIVTTLSGETIDTTPGTAPNWVDEATIHFDTTAGESYILQKYAAVESYAVTVVDGTTDKAAATAGEIVAITANTPASGLVFEKWTADGAVEFSSATSPTATFVMPEQDIVITANFVALPPDEYLITIVGGYGDRNSAAAGTTVTITAAPPANKDFKEWASTSVEVADPQSAVTTFVMPAAAVTVTATFTDELKPTSLYDFKISAGTGGRITVGANGKYEADQQITIAAAADSDYKFDGWVSAGGGSFENPASEATVFTMPENAATVTAKFSYVNGGVSPPVVPPIAPPISGGRSKGGSSSGNIGSTKPDVSFGGIKPAGVITPTDVTSRQATAAANSAAQAAKAAGLTSATAILTNAGAVSLGDLRQMATTAGMPLRLQANSTGPDGKTLEVRIRLDAAKATKDINLFASCSSDVAKAIKANFAKWFKNEIQVVSFNQQVDFGQSVEIAVKLNKALLDKELILYSYDVTTNRYSQIQNTGARVDANGYLHFSTNLAGQIVISAGALEKK